ncbi:MAG TPA: holo-ACP synthase [Clostridiales bacterium]|nr:holo-ACP synthase [Clostridiales bacterium]
MIVGIGLDIIETARVQRALVKPGFLNRVYTPPEQEYLIRRKMNAQSAAGLFAAKEAVSKALGTGIRNFSWQDIEILQDDNGKPYALLKGNALERFKSIGGTNIHISITHIKDLAAAQAVIEG